MSDSKDQEPVNRDIDVDAGHLMATDFYNNLKNENESEILKLTKENGQILINELFNLNRSIVDGIVFINLPEPIYQLPRSKPIPKPKPLTKWQKFAKEKGIKKKKKPKLIWDEESQKWIPRFGYKKNKAEKEKTWVREIPQNADPNEILSKNKKKEKIAKNEYRRLLNIKRAHLITDDNQSSKTLATSLAVAKASTSSLGKSQKKLPNEKETPGISEIIPGHKRKRKPEPMAASKEKRIYLSVADDILNKKSKLDNP